MWAFWGILADKDELGKRLDAKVGVQKAVAQMSRKNACTFGRKNTCSIGRKSQPAKGDQNVYQSFV